MKPRDEGEPDHMLVIERPSQRHGPDCVTATCVCKLWLRSVFRETTINGKVVLDLDEAERVARAAYADHEREIPELRRQAEAFEARARANEQQLKTAKRRGAHADEAIVDQTPDFEEAFT